MSNPGSLGRTAFELRFPLRGRSGDVAEWEKQPPEVQAIWQRIAEGVAAQAFLLVNARYKPCTDPEPRTLTELEHWFERAASHLQQGTPDGNNPAGYKGPHPCDCMAFARDARRKVEALMHADRHQRADGEATNDSSETAA
jgi:hypothetical protein